ncbi:hypothetical protein K7640_19925 [Micromonospora sp. PLK6-60]|uniref:hypothetical protein n=1 Tax=Micromonospora sp. PLK6-60 TaxID=2873383 RepID=UPI001CA6D9B7|nr:hypothetical protein [Micromonospora sp. PLK6-60]MBY8874099.1 hypothetical protein [Micromonospora sp. PLK6-60]
MSEEPLTVHPDLLYRVAGVLDGDAYRLVRGLAGGLPPAPQAAGWRADAELAGLAAAVRGWAGDLGRRLAESAGAVRVAADGYRAVDDRAARRLAAIER